MKPNNVTLVRGRGSPVFVFPAWELNHCRAFSSSRSDVRQLSVTLSTEARKTGYIPFKPRAHSLAGPGIISRHTLVPLHRAAYFTTLSHSSLVLHTCRENISTTGRLKNCSLGGGGKLRREGRKCEMERERRQMRKRGNGTENKNKNTPTRVLEDNKSNMASDCPVAIVDSSTFWALSDNR